MNYKLTAIEKRMLRFQRVQSLRSALNVVQSLPLHSMYQHYTTFDRVIEKITDGKWWLTCCTSDRLNDQREFVKFGDYKTASRMYQTCFSHETAESVAMWGLYQRGKPCAVRITLTKGTMRKWINGIAVSLKNGSCPHTNYKRVIFRDIVYAATADSNSTCDSYDIRRRDSVGWDGVVTSPIENLQDDIHESWATGLLKDYEWRHERETRLLIVAKNHFRHGCMIEIPDFVLEDMRFTFSPWLNAQMIDCAKNQILAALTSKLKHKPNDNIQRFRRSAVSCGLNIGDGRMPCVCCDKCRLFGIG